FKNNREAFGFISSKRIVGRQAKATCIDMKYLNIAVVDRDFVASEAEHVDVDIVQNYVDTRNHYQLVHDNDSAIRADMDGRSPAALVYGPIAVLLTAVTTAACLNLLFA
ncbi:hypothetical protein FOZ63_026778, partial [Perkinsus olseni]